MMHHPLRFYPNIEVPMRDGTVLRANMYRPDGDEPHPVLVSRTPYNKDVSTASGAALRFASDGYVVLVQDCRGRFASDGVFYPMLTEMEDGYDTVEWAARQPWSTGKVGMFGASYVGATQWLAAASAPPHLVAIAPALTGCDYHDGWFYQSGALLLGFVLGWAMNSFALPAVQRLDLPREKKGAIAEGLMEMIDHAGRVMAHLPLCDMPILAEHGLAPYYLDWLAHPDEDDYWRRWNIALHHRRITVPVLAMGGWYDMFLNGTLLNFVGMRKNGATPAARKHQRLIVGPWAHTLPLFGGNQGEVAFGVRSMGQGIDLDGMQLRWFDYWLKGIENGVPQDKPLSLFTVGANRWREAEDWPLPGTRYVKYHFHSRGGANSASGDGGLSPEAPGQEPPDAYVYDPRRPVPTRGGGASGRGGAYDQRPVEARPDVLVYTSPPLAEDLEVTGPIVVDLWAASSARDTDFSAKLVDVSPDGLALNLADNLVRARYRNSLSKQELLEPGKAYRYAIDLYGASNLFKKGHRIRVEISSSNFPRFDRNPNTGGPFGRETEMAAALQTVFHVSLRPSHIVLPAASLTAGPLSTAVARGKRRGRSTGRGERGWRGGRASKA